MFLSTPVGGSGSPILVQLPAISLSNSSSASIVYSGIRFDNDGKIYKMSAGGTWQYAADWLLSGVVADYWLHRTILTGTFTGDDGDALQLNTGDLDYYLQNSVEWFARGGTINFEIADDASKTNVYATHTYAFSAYKEGTGSPP